MADRRRALSVMRQRPLQRKGFGDVTQHTRDDEGLAELFNRSSSSAVATSEAARVRRLGIVVVSFLQFLVAIVLMIIIFAVFNRFNAITIVPFLAIGLVQVAHGLAMWFDHERPIAIMAIAINIVMLAVSFFAFGLQVRELAQCWNSATNSCYLETMVSLSTGAVITVCEGICPSNTSNIFQLIFVLAFITLSVIQMILSVYILVYFDKIKLAEDYLTKAVSEGESTKEVERAARRVLEEEIKYGVSDNRSSLELQLEHDKVIQERLRREREIRSNRDYAGELSKIPGAIFSSDTTTSVIGNNYGDTTSTGNYMTKRHSRLHYNRNVNANDNATSHHSHLGTGGQHDTHKNRSRSLTPTHHTKHSHGNHDRDSKKHFGNNTSVDKPFVCGTLAMADLNRKAKTPESTPSSTLAKTLRDTFT